MKNSPQIALICTFILCIYVSTKAQIVNIEDRRTAFSDSIGWFENINLSADLIKNTQKIFRAKGAVQLEFQHTKRRFISISEFQFLRVGAQAVLNDGLQHLRYNYFVNKFYTHEVFTQLQYNENTQIKIRALVGTGARFCLLEKEKNRIFWGLAYMYEYNEENSARNIFRDHRMSTYLSLAVRPFHNVRLSSTSYYQPQLNLWKNYRLSSESTIVIDLSKIISFTGAFTISYDQRKREGVPRLLYQWTNGIRLRL